MKDNKLKIYFLLQSKAFFPSWKSFLNACLNDERINVKVIYCPVMKTKKGWDGQFDKTEEWLKKENIKYTHIKNINLLLDRPDLLFFQTPYDYTHRIEKYRTTRYKIFGFNIGYISYGLEFTEAKHNIVNHFRLPIQSNCWRIYTFSQEIVNDYAKYCPIGNNHVRCVGHPKFDALYNASSIEMPKWLKEKVNGRKIICWHPHFPCDYSTKNGEKVISTFPWEENLKILNYIKNDKKHFYIFMAHHIFFGAFENDYNVPQADIIAFKNSLNDGENSIIWNGEYPEILQWSDIFMGERSAVTMEMITTGKPVVYLENCSEIYNKFGKDVISSYYYAQNANRAIEILKQLVQGEDPNKELRKIVFNKYILPYWDGKCGERIKDDILKSKDELYKSNWTILTDYIKAFIKIYILNPIFEITIFERPTVSHKIIRIFGIKLKFKISERKEQ